MAERFALFLDRDGTLIRYVNYLHRPEEVELLAGVAGSLSFLKKAGGILFLFTNQSGVGRGLFSQDAVEAVHRRMFELIGLGNDLFTEICVACEPPGQPSPYRKPSPRFILEVLAKYRIAKESAVMIGDNPSDWEAGINAGIQAVAVRSPIQTEHSEEIRAKLNVPIYDGLLDWVKESFPGAPIVP